MLEMPRRVGSKILSHMLTSHAGEIFIHNLATTRSVLEDPPSISEGPGGRVTDYRITDLGEVMKANRLAPWFSDKALVQAQNRVARFARFCPMTISSTTIFNMAVLEPLQRIMMQEELSEEDLAECRKVIYTLLSMENKSEVLPVPVLTTNTGKMKTMKKEEQYKTMYAELEKFLACHSSSEKHAKVLDCLLEVRNKPPMTDRPSARYANDGDKIEVEKALQEIERYSGTAEKSDFNLTTDGVLRSTTESPMSPTSSGGPPVKKAYSSFGSGGKSLLDIWTHRIQKENAKKHVPFHGLRNLGEKAKLYLSLERAAKETEMDVS
jgi:hypothetical protein